jgi:hypothetical protein
MHSGNINQAVKSVLQRSDVIAEGVIGEVS